MRTSINFAVALAAVALIVGAAGTMVLKSAAQEAGRVSAFVLKVLMLQPPVSTQRVNRLAKADAEVH